jgi:hypothetical protein
MTHKLFRLATVGLVGCALITPFGGCNNDPGARPTIDTSNASFKAPGAPSTGKVEVKRPGKAPRK